MSNINEIISVTKGMVEDLHDLNKSSDNPTYVLNGMVSDFTGKEFFIQNEPSNIYKLSFPEGFKVIGFKSIYEQNRIIFFLINEDLNTYQIGEVINCKYYDKTDEEYFYHDCEDCVEHYNFEQVPLEKKEQVPYCSYKVITESPCLNFNINNPIDIEYVINACSIDLYFTDNLNQRRHLELDYENENPSNNLVLNRYYKNIIGYSDDECQIPIYDNTVDCNKLSYHPEFKKPCILFEGFTSGGNLKAGSYQFLFAYADEKGEPLTQYFPATQSIPLKTKSVTVQTDYETDRAIILTINNIEKNVYEYFNLVVAETLNNFTTFKLVNTFSTRSSEVNNILKLTYTGLNNIRNLTPSDVIFRKPYYKTALSVTKSNNYLFFSNLKEFEKPNLQRVANNIKLNWETIAIPESVYSDPKNSFNYRTYQRDEVYAFGIVFEFNHGEDSCAYHIPGREPNSYDLEYVTGDDVYNTNVCDTASSIERWKVYNTGSVSLRPHLYTTVCGDEKTWESGEFAYWQSEYRYDNIPEIWGDLCGKNIRHHKFPDSCITHIHDSLNGNKKFSENNIVFPIGVKVDHLSIINSLNKAVRDGLITEEQKNSIKGYRIVRANRSGNKSIVAKGLLYDMWKYDLNGRKYCYANYPFNDLRPDDFLSPNISTYSGSTTSNPVQNLFNKEGRYTFHSPDIHFTNPTIGSFIKLETEEYGESEGFFEEAKEQAKYKRLTTFVRTIALGIASAEAFSEIGLRECKTVTIKAESVASALGFAAGAATIGGNLPLPYGATFNQGTGLPIMQEPILPGILGPSETTKTTCRGTPYQILGPAYVGDITGKGFLQVMQTAIKFATGALNQASYILSKILIAQERWLEFFNSLIPAKNYAIQYQAVGKYNNYKCVANGLGNKIRSIERSAYLAPIIQSVNETSTASSGIFETININNWNRESSLYIKIDQNKNYFPNTSVVDNSRITMDNVGINAGDSDKFTKLFYRDISSYYASIKNFIPNQYGTLSNIEYLETDGCLYLLENGRNDNIYFGGDTFINRFALKRKMPFFTQTRFRFTDYSDVTYSELGNVAYPNYYFNTEEPLFDRLSDFNLSISNLGSLFQRIIGVERGRLDGRTNKLFYQNGFIHLYNYGIPYFFVESDVNVDFRHAENLKEKSYYPLSSDLRDWLQEKNVPITEDNYYSYNSTYSKQNKESFICSAKNTEDSIRVCQTILPNSLIYSDPKKFKIFKANSLYNFPLTDGLLISADGIESDKVLVRLKNTSKIFAAYNTIQATGENIQVGTGGMFESRPQEFSVSDLGYGGSQHRSILHTEYGHIWVDVERGQVFNLSTGGSGLEELTKDGLRNWFKQNLPFQIKKDFPEILQEDLDNNFKGIGLHLGFDKRFARFFITKLDYKVLNKDIVYNTSDKKFYLDNEVVELDNSKYFCNKSWTVSYSFFSKGWISYHTYKPNYYISNIDSFDSGLNNNSTLWSHLVTNKSYQVFYGKIEPFIVEFMNKASIQNSFVTSVEYGLDVIRYHNEYDNFYNQNIGFNKAIVYNNNQISGLLELVNTNPDDLSQIGTYPIIKPNSTEILTSNSENIWRFNDFFDLSKSEKNNLPLFLNTCSNDNKIINSKAINYFKPEFEKGRIRARQSKVRLINDKYSNYKFIFLFSQLNKNTSIR